MKQISLCEHGGQIASLHSAVIAVQMRPIICFAHPIRQRVLVRRRIGPEHVREAVKRQHKASAEFFRCARLLVQRRCRCVARMHNLRLFNVVSLPLMVRSPPVIWEAHRGFCDGCRRQFPESSRTAQKAAPAIPLQRKSAHRGRKAAMSMCNHRCFGEWSAAPAPSRL